MIKNPRPVGFPCRYQHLGQPHPSKILATSRILIQSAKRRARIPVPSSFYHGPYSESRPERDYGILTRNPTPSPRRFRPTFLKSKDVDPNFISSIEPVFKGLPVEAIRATLYQGPEQWDAIDCFEAEPPLAVIPKIMELVCDDRALITCPTHFLAVYRQAPLELSPRLPRICWKFSYRRDVSIYPVHSLPLLLYCTNLPPIPKSPPEITTIREGNKETKPLSILRLPVIPLRIPYPSVFPMMLQMFYSAHSRQLSYNLVPVRLPVNPTWSLSRVCNEHAVTIANQISDIETIEGYRQRIWMVYRNGCVLRITTGSFWDTLVINWEGTFVALELHKRRKSLELQQEKCLDDQIWSFQIVDGRDKFGLIPKPPSPVLVDAGTQTRVSSPSDSMIE